MIEQTFLIPTEKDWQPLADALLAFAKGRKKMVFYGEIGAGKTTFIQQICKRLGVKDLVNSPTFALVNVYESPIGEVHHLDLYRLQNTDEALHIGIEDYLDDSHYCFVEWPEIIENHLPSDVVKIRITLGKDLERKVVFYSQF